MVDGALFLGLDGFPKEQIGFRFLMTCLRKILPHF